MAAITFAQFANGEIKIEHRSALVIGFMVQTFEHEILFAIDNFNRIWTSEVICRPNSHFDCKERVWHRTSEIPDEAEFIGHYSIQAR